MRAIQLITPGHALEMRELPDPDAGPADVVVDVTAAGICRSDVHYRAGFPKVGPLPLTLGHEVSGVVHEVGTSVDSCKQGDRVCIHYQTGCGACSYCDRDLAQFCVAAAMIGKSRHGGYAERIVVPDRNVIPVPDTVPLEHAAVMMCSSATSLHALRKGRLEPGESVAIFGAGGLGMSAVQLARINGASRVYAIDINPRKLDRAAALGATVIAADDDPVRRLREAGGVDVALDLVGSATVMKQCLHSLAPMGRAVAVGLTGERLSVGPYTDLVNGEAELIGASDHTAAEIMELLELAAAGRLELSGVVQRRIPLDAAAVNDAMDELERFGDTVRTVIVPEER
jgi:2-desacetyl-2-hydroxyethyl bacteriochlorophyllide A dehydrogenase